MPLLISLSVPIRSRLQNRGLQVRVLPALWVPYEPRRRTVR